MSRDADLLRAPPRMSDLRGDDFRRAISARHEANRARWRAQYHETADAALVRHRTSRNRSPRLFADIVTTVALVSAGLLIAFIAPPTVRWIARGAPSASVASLPAKVTPSGAAVEAGRTNLSEVR